MKLAPLTPHQVPILATHAPASRYGHDAYIATLKRFEKSIPFFGEASDALVEAASKNTCSSAPEFYTHLEKAWAAPHHPDALGFATFFFDAIHYGLKLSPQKVAPSAPTFSRPPADTPQVGKYPLGAAVRPSNLASSVAQFEPLVSPSPNADLAPSLQNLLVQFCMTDAYNPSLPIVRAEARPITKAATSAYAEVAAKCCVPVDDTFAIVPISTAEWDNKQLEWGRVLHTGVGVPECSNGPDCQALEIPMNQGPLQAYLSPDEEESGIIPDAPHFCLLCIRYALLLAGRSCLADTFAGASATPPSSPLKPRSPEIPRDGVAGPPGRFHRSRTS